MIHVCHYNSPLGDLLLAAEDEKLIGAWFESAKYYGSLLKSDRVTEEEDPALHGACEWLDAYFRGMCPDPNALPLCLKGSAFRVSVLKALLSIPYGGTTTYGAIANRLAAETGKNVSAQAVGGAVGHNPISVIIPCHRVLGADGSLTGYAGGLDRKRRLLLHESGNSIL